jgi:hypothetical protein
VAFEQRPGMFMCAYSVIRFANSCPIIPRANTAAVKSVVRSTLSLHTRKGIPFARREIHRTFSRLAGAIAFLPRSKGVPIYRVDVAVEHKMENEGESHISSD